MFQKIRSVAGGVLFLLLCAGGAFAMPASFDAEPDDEGSVATLNDVTEDLDLEPVEVAPEGETTDVTVPDENDEGEGQEDEDSDRPEKAENHGKAVSTAAHCDLTGRAKGAFVSSVARDKTATAESAQAACDAAMAAQDAAPAKGKPAKAAKADKTSKPDRAPKPVKAAKPDKAPKAPKTAKQTQPEPVVPPASEASRPPKGSKATPAPVVEEPTTEPAPANPASDPGPPAGKGNSKKP